jgi:uncharacterized protein (TIGR00661 family)
MARILYGVMGDARGHVNRALTVAQEMPHHEFLFVGGGRVHDLESSGYHVLDVPVPATLYRDNKVDVPATVGNALRIFFLRKRRTVDRIAEIILSYRPDLIITDYEYFTPLAARRAGRACVSLDHQHVLTHCHCEPPPVQRVSRLMTNFAVRRLYSSASSFLVVSFYRLPPKDPQTTRVLPPIIRPAVREHAARAGEHVLVYQTSPTFHRLFPVLEQMKGPFFIYGFGEKPPRKNLVFKGPSNHAFLEDLASSRYVVVNGGHNVISEALYFGKPVMSFPIANAYEQFINAFYLARLGYGDFSTVAAPSREIFDSFESRLDFFRRNIERGNFFGNVELIDCLETLVQR